MIASPIVDPHIHLWDPRSTPRIVSPLVKLLGWNEDLLARAAKRAFPASSLDFVGRTDEVLHAYLPGRWFRDGEGWPRRGFVHVEASWQGRAPLAPARETAWLERLCGSDLLAIVGAAKLDDSALGALLDAHRDASPRFVGVRDKMAWSEHGAVADWTDRPDALSDPRWLEGLRELGRRDLTFDAWVYQPQLRQLDRALAAAPDTRVVLDHLGTPIGLGGPVAGFGGTAAARDDLALRWHDDLACLAAHPHLVAKISGLTMPIVGWGFHERATPPTVDELVDRLGPHVEAAIAAFGASRCMFASNFPMDRVSVAWSTLFEAFDQIVGGASDQERAALFGETAARVYRGSSSADA